LFIIAALPECNKLVLTTRLARYPGLLLWQQYIQYTSAESSGYLLRLLCLLCMGLGLADQISAVVTWL